MSLRNFGILVLGIAAIILVALSREEVAGAAGAEDCRGKQGSMVGCSAANDKYGMLPGEPDPSSHSSEFSGTGAIDNRSKCPKGQRRMQRFECRSEKKQLECSNYAPVLDCTESGKKPKELNCPEGQKVFPVYQCVH